jgi:hypothetical protein
MAGETPANPLPSNTKKTEPKVAWATVAAGVLTVLLYVANNADLIPGYSDAPNWVKAIVTVVIIAGGAFGAGRAAPHQWRTSGPARRSTTIG